MPDREPRDIHAAADTPRPMSGRKAAYPQPIRDYVIAQVLDHGHKIQPTVKALNRGDVEGLPTVPVSYSVARGWVADEQRKRDAARPLEDEALEAFVQRLWAVAGRELRKLERDAATSKPLDAKRLNELEAFAARCRRHLRARDESPGDDPKQPAVAQPDSLLARLAAEDQPNDPPRRTSPEREEATTADHAGNGHQPHGPTETETDERKALGPAHSAATTTQPSVALPA